MSIDQITLTTSRHILLAMEDRKDVTVPMPRKLVEQLDGQLGYGDSRAEWIRKAVRQRLERVESGNQTRLKADD